MSEAIGPRTVVLVTVDTLRADYVSFGGAPTGTTPYLDSLAKDGVIFDRAYAPSSWTVPSMASLFVGRTPKSHGVISSKRHAKTKVITQPALAESFVTLAESFQKAGYVTIGVPSNRHLDGRLGFAQGFDHYPDETRFLLTTPEVNRQTRLALREAFGNDWRTSWKQQKVFLWIHYFDPHAPYHARKPWIDKYAPAFATRPQLFPVNISQPALEKRLKKPDSVYRDRVRPLYHAEVSYFDSQLERLGDELGFDDPDAALIVTSDHGEELAEHGGFFHGHSLYEEVVRVPLLVRWPRGFDRVRRTSEPASLIDVYPTLLDLCGIEAPAGLQGASLEPVLRGGTLASERGLALELGPRPLKSDITLIGWIRSDWKLIRERAPGSGSQLYRLSEDPGEKHDLAATNRDLVRRLELELKRWLDAAPLPPADRRDVATEDKELLEELKALGYVGR